VSRFFEKQKYHERVPNNKKKVFNQIFSLFGAEKKKEKGGKDEKKKR
jgi:hypothetical protein